MNKMVPLQLIIIIIIIIMEKTEAGLERPLYPRNKC